MNGGSLKAQTLSALKWNAIGQVGRQSLSFIVSILLARLLSPQDFGLIAMLFVFQEIANALLSAGLNAPLIQRAAVSEEDRSTIFYFNIGMGLLCYLVLIGCAPYLAAFLKEPQLERLITYYGLIFLIHSFGNVQIGLLLRALNYRQLNVIALVGVLLAGIVAIVMAINAYGVYSLLGQQICYALITTALYWRSAEWRPSFAFSATSFRRLFGFGSKVLLVSLLDKILGTVDNLIIGKLQGTAFLGQYSRGKTTRDLPLSNIMTVITSLVFPLFSRIERADELRVVLGRFLGVVSYLTAPLMVGTAILAEPLIVVLYSDKWLPAVPFLQLFCTFGVTIPLNSIMVQTLLSSGRAGVFLKLELYKKVILLAAMSLGAFLGPVGLVVTLSIANYTALFLSVYSLARTLETPASGLVRDMLPGVALALLSGIPIYLTSTAPWGSDLIQIVASAGVGLLSYVALSTLLECRDYLFLKRLAVERLFPKSAVA